MASTGFVSTPGRGRARSRRHELGAVDRRVRAGPRRRPQADGGREARGLAGGPASDPTLDRQRPGHRRTGEGGDRPPDLGGRDRRAPRRRRPRRPAGRRGQAAATAPGRPGDLEGVVRAGTAPCARCLRRGRPIPPWTGVLTVVAACSRAAVEPGVVDRDPQREVLAAGQVPPHVGGREAEPGLTGHGRVHVQRQPGGGRVEQHRPRGRPQRDRPGRLGGQGTGAA